MIVKTRLKAFSVGTNELNPTGKLYMILSFFENARSDFLKRFFLSLVIFPPLFFLNASKIALQRHNVVLLQF